MADLTLFCLVERTTVLFSFDISPTRTVDHLKDSIKAKNAVEFKKNVDAKDLTVWYVSILIGDGGEWPCIKLKDVSEKKKLDSTTRLSKLFPDGSRDSIIQIIVQRPPVVGQALDGEINNNKHARDASEHGQPPDARRKRTIFSRIIRAMTRFRRSGTTQVRSETTQARSGPTRVRYGARVTVPAFKNMTYGDGFICRASWQGEDVVVKKCDIWKKRALMRKLKHEARVYGVLKKLQGRWIPRLKIAGIAEGVELILVTEFVGTSISHECLDHSDRKKIRAALSAIHDSGVLHGDIQPYSIVVRRNGHGSRFSFIHFGHSEITTDKCRMKHEMEQLERLLDSLSRPKEQPPPKRCINCASRLIN